MAGQSLLAKYSLPLPPATTQPQAVLNRKPRLSLNTGMGLGTQSTTTEKLVVSRAIDIYGPADEASVTRYIAMMYGYIHPERWKEIYKEVLCAYKEHGYSSPVDFCEDLRFDAARRLYVQKVELRTRLLEGEDVGCPEEHPKHNWNIGDIDRISRLGKGSSEPALDSRQLYPTVDPRVIIQHVEAMNRQQADTALPDAQNKVLEAREALSMGTEKERKRFYTRMSDEEREIDDFLDRMEEEDYGVPRGNVAPNKLKGKYPMRKALGTEAKLRSPPETGDQGSLTTHYRMVIKRIAGKTGSSGDGEVWRRELKVITQYHMRKIGMSSELEKVGALIDSSSMAHVLMNILMLLQETVNRSKSAEVVSDCISFKKDLILFGDHYRG